MADGSAKGAGDCSVIVAVRVRPLNKREKDMNSNLCTSCSTEFSSMDIKNPQSKQKHTFTYDYTWDSTDPDSEIYASQETVYNDVGKKVLAACFQGYNACIFAYGQTGSGKTFAMMGVPDDKELQGVIPRLSKAVFDKITSGESPPNGVKSISYTVEASYLEIYQEHVQCLLNPRKGNLKVREHPVTGPYVEDLTRLVVNDYGEVLKLIEDGSAVRQVAATNMNDTSSRSHAIFTLLVTTTKVLQEAEGGKGRVVHDTVSRINLVDLAGSERAKSTGATGTRLAEGAQINKSLSTLGLVISGLAEASKRKGGSGAHIPFRDSTLTWLLKDNLGGNSKTFMISTISPSSVNHDETLSTLRYADRAKAIVTKARVNEDPNTKLIRQLREEVRYPQAIHTHLHPHPPPPHTQLAKYKTKLSEFEEKFSGDAGGGGGGGGRKEGMPPPAPLHGVSRSIAVPSGGPRAKAAAGAASSEEDAVPSPTSTSPNGSSAGAAAGAGLLLPMAQTPMAQTPRGEDGLLQTPRVPTTRAEAAAVRERLLSMEKLIAEAGMSHEEKRLHTAEEEQERQQAMQQMGIKVVHADVEMPHFVNLIIDGGWLLQHLHSPAEEYELVVGSSDDCDIKLLEPGADGAHAVIRSTPGDGVTIAPAAEGCVVNVHQICAETGEELSQTLQWGSAASTAPLTHGARVNIGENLFRYVDPRISADKKAEMRRLQISALNLRSAGGSEPATTPGLATPASSVAPTFAAAAAEEEAAKAAATPAALPLIEQEAPPLQTALDPAAQEEQRAEDERKEAELREKVRAEIMEEMAVTVTGTGSRNPSPALTPISNPSITIPALKLHEVAGGAMQQSTLLPRAPGSGRRSSFLKAKDNLPTKPLTVRYPNEPLIQIFKHNLVFVGAEGVGKTSVKKCLERELSFWERKDCPETGPTLGAEYDELRVAVKGAQVVLMAQDISGNAAYDTALTHTLPEQRTMIVLVWDLSASSYEESVIIDHLDAALVQCPSLSIVLVGTHRDDCKESDDAVQKLLNVVERAVLKRIKEVYRMHKELGSPFPAPQMLGAYAVSCKNRTVYSEGETSKFKDLLQVMAEAAFERCVRDPYFGGANVPSSVLVLARKVIAARGNGDWVLSAADFKQMAVSSASKYTSDLKELARVTSLLHSWRVLLHFGGHPVMRKQVFTDPAWVLGLLNAISVVVHYQNACNCGASQGGSGRLSDRVLTYYATLQNTGGSPPFNPSELFHQDQTNSFARGLLSVPLAVCLFRTHLAQIGCGPREVARCLHLLHGFDLLFAAVPPKEGAAILPTTPFPSSDGKRPEETIAAAAVAAERQAELRSKQEKEKKPSAAAKKKDKKGGGSVFQGNQQDADQFASMDGLVGLGAPVCFIPSLFTRPAPRVLWELLPSLLAGGHRKLVFRPSIPKGLFARLTSRVSRCVSRVYVGRFDGLTSDPYANNFWRDFVWVQDSSTTRALLFLEESTHSVHIVTSVCNTLLRRGHTGAAALMDAAQCTTPKRTISLLATPSPRTGRTAANNNSNNNAAAGAASGGGSGGSSLPPSLLLTEGLLKATRSIAAEHPGVHHEEFHPCGHAGCAGWVAAREERQSKGACAACGREQAAADAEGVLRAGAADEARSAALARLDDTRREAVLPLVERVETAAVEEPTDADVDEARRCMAALLSPEEAAAAAAAEQFDLETVKMLIDSTLALRANGREEEASRLEAALVTLQTHEKLARSAAALDGVVEALTGGDAFEAAF